MNERHDKKQRQGRCLLRHPAGTNAGRRFGWVSGNWSGYAQPGKKRAYRRISAQWNVPFLRPTTDDSFSSVWIGIDGFSNGSLIQTGTGQMYVGGRARYYAWWEILPDFETVIPLPVRPGDRMSASIAKIGPAKWDIRLCNRTRGWVFRTVRRYSGPQTSAEWIVEAPQIGPLVARMARLSPVVFSCCRVNGRNPRLTPAQGGVMMQDGEAVAVPSLPARCGDAFNVRTRSFRRRHSTPFRGMAVSFRTGSSRCPRRAVSLSTGSSRRLRRAVSRT